MACVGRQAGSECLRKQNEKDYYDYNLIAVIILLIGFGLVMLYSTTAYRAGIRFSDDMYFLRKQAVFAAFSILVAVLLSFVDYHILWKLSGVIYVLSLLLLFVVRFTPLGLRINGAKRWLSLGPLSFQPSEACKVAVIVFVPMLIIRMGRSFRELKGCIMPIAAGGIQALAVFVLTSNLSTAFIIFCITAVIVFVAHPQTGKLMLIAAGCAAVAAVVLMAIIFSGGKGGFRSMRIMVWLRPEEYASQGGYQIMQALYAIGSGGLFGKGLGNGIQKLSAVPEAENDMIFSIICEELGIFGGVIVILLFIYLLYRLLFISQNAPDLYGSLMVTGVFAHIAVQVIMNICVVTNVIPTTGVTLPFVSYGGTSLFFLMMEMAIALSVSRRIHSRNKETDLWGEVAEPLADD